MLWLDCVTFYPRRQLFPNEPWIWLTLQTQCNLSTCYIHYIFRVCSSCRSSLYWSKAAFWNIACTFPHQIGIKIERKTIMIMLKSWLVNDFLSILMRCSGECSPDIPKCCLWYIDWSRQHSYIQIHYLTKLLKFIEITMIPMMRLK